MEEKVKEPIKEPSEEPLPMETEEEESKEEPIKELIKEVKDLEPKVSLKSHIPQLWLHLSPGRLAGAMVANSSPYISEGI